MNVTELLDRPIAYHRIFVNLTGSVKAAILLSQALYWQKRAKQADGWWYKTAEEWQEETGLSKREQDTARKECSKYLQTDLRGVPATLFWKVDEQVLTNDLIQFSGKRETGLDESAKQVSRETPNVNRNAETTTETTTEREIAPALDFSSMTVAQAYKVPEIAMYARVTGRFPASVIWEKIVTFVREQKVEEGKLKDAAEAWIGAGFNPSNINGILEWAAFGIPDKYRPKTVSPNREQSFEEKLARFVKGKTA